MYDQKKKKETKLKTITYSARDSSLIRVNIVITTLTQSNLEKFSMRL